METIHHHHSDNNIIKVLLHKVVAMFQKEDHTLGEFLLLYALIFVGMLVLVVVTDILFRFNT